MISLHTDRLTLRNFRADDAPALFDYLHRPGVSCFYSLALKDLAQAQTEAARRGANDEYLAVCLKDSGQLVGDLFATQEGDTFSVGWNFNPRFAGAGYAHEAASALFEDLFATRGARRLYAYTEDTNLASQRLCEKLGMRREGLFLEFIAFTHDRDGAPIYENTMQYAILRKEWQRAAVTDRA